MKSPRITWISSDDPPHAFPSIDNAFDVPDGLLAAGGDLSQARLLYAYSHGIFPWSSEGQPILWWSPDPRCVLRPTDLHVSRRLRRTLMRSRFQVTFNAAFRDVIRGCAKIRPGQEGTWITADMQDAYLALHASGWAHSIEVWSSDRLAGGLYGLAIGKVFFGESMFSGVSHASKAAMLALCTALAGNGFDLLDCQVGSPHLTSLGATMMSRRTFAAQLQKSCTSMAQFRDWPAERLNIGQLLLGTGDIALQ